MSVPAESSPSLTVLAIGVVGSLFSVARSGLRVSAAIPLFLNHYS